MKTITYIAKPGGVGLLDGDFCLLIGDSDLDRDLDRLRDIWGGGDGDLDFDFCLEKSWIELNKTLLDVKTNVYYTELWSRSIFSLGVTDT